MAFVDGQKVALAGYKAGDPSGVPISLTKASLFERGKYLAEAADCMACHTSRGGKFYAGGLAIRLPFGTLYSTSITPDKEAGIGNYSDQEFLSAVHRRLGDVLARTPLVAVEGEEAPNFSDVCGL